MEADKQGGGHGFPFDLAHLVFYQQLQALLPALEALRDFANFDRGTLILCDRVIKAIRPVVQDSQLSIVAPRIEKQAVLFDEFRTAMRLADPDTGKGLNDDGLDSDIHSIKMAVTQYRQSVSIRLDLIRYA